MNREVREIALPRWAEVTLLFGAIGLALYWLSGVLTPILLAFSIAYVLDPVVDRLVAWRIPRGLAVALIMLLVLGAITLFVLLVVPAIVSDISAVIQELPDAASGWLAKAQDSLARVGVDLPTTSTELADSLRKNAEGLTSQLAAPVGTALGWIVGGTASAVGAVVGALIVPVLAVYLLYDFDRIIEGIRDLVPVKQRETVVSYAREIDEVLGQFIRGQLLVMAILAVLYGGSYSLLGVRMAIPIGITAGMLNFVPYLGSAFALIAGLTMCAVGGGSIGQLVGVVIAYAAIQGLEGFFITPKVVG